MFYVNISLALANKRMNSVIINNLKKQLTVLIQREERHALLQYVHVIFNDTINCLRPPQKKQDNNTHALQIYNPSPFKAIHMPSEIYKILLNY